MTIDTNGSIHGTDGKFSEKAQADAPGGTANLTMAAPAKVDIDVARMTQRQFLRHSGDLAEELATAEAAVQEFNDANPDGSVISDDTYYAWNAAHDRVTAAESRIKYDSQTWRQRNLDPNTMRLIANNID